MRGRGMWAYRRGLLQVTEPILRKRGSDFSRHAVYNSHGKIVEGTLGWRHCSLCWWEVGTLLLFRDKHSCGMEVTTWRCLPRPTEHVS